MEDLAEDGAVAALFNSPMQINDYAHALLKFFRTGTAAIA
jgi:hypothetical protein